MSSIAKAKRLLGYEPQMGFEAGLKKVHAWFVDNWADIERSASFEKPRDYTRLTQDWLVDISVFSLGFCCCSSIIRRERAQSNLFRLYAS